jgi:hypothetical protein
MSLTTTPTRPTYRPLAELARELGVHVATLSRWHQRGILRDGVRERLWAIRLGGRWVTTDAELVRFLGRLNSGQMIPSPSERQQAAAAASRELDRILGTTAK